MKKVWKRRYLRLARELGVKKTLKLLYEDYRDGILSKSTYYRIKKILETQSDAMAKDKNATSPLP